MSSLVETARDGIERTTRTQAMVIMHGRIKRGEIRCGCGALAQCLTTSRDDIRAFCRDCSRNAAIDRDIQRQRTTRAAMRRR